MRTFLPYVTSAELEAADMETLCELTARARLVQELWRDTYAAAIVKALGNGQ